MPESKIKSFQEYKKPYLPREKTLVKVDPFIGKDVIKIFTGQRRVGKSYMLFQIGDIILSNNEKANIIYINKEFNEFDFIQDYNDLHDYVESRLVENANCLFIDEVQDITHFEKALRSLLAKGGIDIYCTGSNADLLSGDIAGYLSGRSVEIPVFSLSYDEFQLFHDLPESRDTFNKYLRYGGLPYLMHLQLRDHIIFDYLKNIYSTIIYKDVVRRFNIRNTYFLEQLVKFCADNTGQLFSAKRISDFLKSQRVNMSVQAILNYLEYLTDAFLIFKVKRMEISGRKLFETGEKFYFQDIGLRNSIIGFQAADISKLLENIVFMHLVSRGYQVKIGSQGEHEIDFVAEKLNDTLYIQVTYTMTEEKTILREAGNLLKIKDNHPKYIISMDEFPASNYSGIIQMNIREFLMGMLI